MIHQLREQGLTICEIARRMRVDRKTVRRYLQHGVEQPRYGPRAPRPQKLDPYRAYLRGRLAKCPQLSAMRLLREIRDLGYQGGRTAVTDFVAAVRPREATSFEHRFETAPGEQAQVDFAQFKVVFAEQPEQVQVVWLFSMVLGHCRYLFGRFVMRANLEAVVGWHVAAFAEFAGVPREVLYDRMKTVVLGEDDEGEIRYHPTLLDVAAHYGFGPRVCAAYRAKTKGKVERPFRYVREDFFLASQFDNLRHLNAEFDRWRIEVANRRQHGTTRRVVEEAFTEERGGSCSRCRRTRTRPCCACSGACRAMGWSACRATSTRCPTRSRGGSSRSIGSPRSCACMTAVLWWPSIRCSKVRASAEWPTATARGHHQAVPAGSLRP